MRKRSFRFHSKGAAIEYMAALLEAGYSFEAIPAYGQGEGEPLMHVDVITPFDIEPADFPDPHAMGLK